MSYFKVIGLTLLASVTLALGYSCGKICEFKPYYLSFEYMSALEHHGVDICNGEGNVLWIPGITSLCEWKHSMEDSLCDFEHLGKDILVSKDTGHLICFTYSYTWLICLFMGAALVVNYHFSHYFYKNKKE